MSRTDKDRPYAVRIRDPYEPTETNHWHHRTRWALNPHNNENGICTLNAFDNAVDLINSSWSFPCDRSIPYWAPGGSVYRHVPSWFVAARWHRPERRRTRDTLRTAAKAYRGHVTHRNDIDGDFDFDFPNYQARHGARRDWW